MNNATQPVGKKLGWKGWTAIVIAGLLVLGAVTGEDEEGSRSAADNGGQTEVAAAATPEPTATPKPSVEVKLANPSSGSVIRRPSVRVRGTVSPADAKVRINGRRSTVRDGRYSGAVALDVGENGILVEAKARGFTADEATRSVTRKRSAAELARIRERREAARQARIAALTQTFSGNGSQSIGTITVEEESVLEWTNFEAEFPEFRQMLIYDKGFGISVSSDAESGRTIVEPGRYRSVTVAGADWNIVIRPR